MGNVLVLVNSTADDHADDIVDRIDIYSKAETISLSEAVLLRLKNNYPNIKALDVQFGEGFYNNNDTFDALSIDWENEGQLSIGDNTHLKKLNVEMNSRITMTNKKNVEAFCIETARNRYISHLSIDFSYGSSTFFTVMISRLFNHNNIVDLTLQNIHLDSGVAHLLSLALSKGNKLQVFHLNCCSPIDDMYSAGEIAEALPNHKNLRLINFHLGKSYLGRSLSVLGSLLEDPSKLEEISLSNTNVDDEGAAIFGKALLNNTTLKTFSIWGNKHITSNGWIEFFRCLVNPNSALEYLNLESNNLGDKGIMALGSGLANNTSVKELLLEGVTVSTFGWQSFFRELKGSSKSVLENLDMLGTNIGDEAGAALVSSLGGLSSLKKLMLFATDFTSTGWHIISSILLNPNCRLEDLSLSNHTQVGMEAAISFAHVLSENSTLKSLYLSSETIDESGGTLTEGFDTFANVLCNTTSIDETYTSNHTLNKFTLAIESHDLRSHHLITEPYLQLNKSDNKAQVARHKIILYYFLNGGNVNVEKFIEMDVVLLPSAMSWMGRDAVGLPLLYHFVHSMPCLLNHDGVMTMLGAKKRSNSTVSI